MNKISSRIPNFYNLSIEQRINKISEIFSLNQNEIDLLKNNSIDLDIADKMIENAIGTFSLPIGLGLNFLINGKDYIVPMVVEEPSVIAAASSAAKIIRQAGGFKATSTESMMIGQIQVVNCDFEKAKKIIIEQKDVLINIANNSEPKMKERGGGAKDLEVRILGNENEYPYCKMLVIHLLIDTCDAMGANLINTMCEAVSPYIEEITGGKVYLRILSNFTDKRLAKAEVKIPYELFDNKNYKGKDVVEGIIQAQNFAYLDTYRATTHNKGILNGIDPVVIATGNDWRAIEAGIHAYACKNGHYRSLTKWYKDNQDNLIGELELPMAVGIVGGATKIHPLAQLCLKILGVKSARELAEVIVCVGLAQNLSAIKSLATEGIQKGHMALHARNVAASAGAKGDLVNIIAKELVKLNEIKIDKAKSLLKEYSIK
ncbi:MAG: 3-hydroxy-3-methylglutaryl coenzyme A reductase [Candidatus Sericytochromatia bacterium]|nr:MAG: 3-hydroxy-3-methylglutaryl coenzyme A reductase [Candidatus Sericytochromatia bacterium]